MADIGTTALAVFSQIKTNCADAVVSCTFNGVTADAVRTSLRVAGELDAAGYTDRDTRTVYLPYATVGNITNGQRGTVGGVPVEVVAAAPDPAGALIRVDYVQRPAAVGVRP